MIFASDSRTNAGIDNFAKFCKMTVFERKGERVIVLLSSGNLAGTQADHQRVDPTRRRPGQQGVAVERAHHVRHGQSGFRRHARHRTARWSVPRSERISFNASFILGGQIRGEGQRLFRIYAEGNFIEAGVDTPYIQTGETKYGKPLIDRVIMGSTRLADAVKCILVSFDSTMRSNLSVGMPIDLICYERDSLEIRMRRRFAEGDTYFTSLHQSWSEGTRRVFRELPELVW
ncbi:MAG: peptidase [Candidatus Accumulibacter necessarius]